MCKLKMCRSLHRCALGFCFALLPYSAFAVEAGDPGIQGGTTPSEGIVVPDASTTANSIAPEASAPNVETYGPVKRGDTLFAIAKKTMPARVTNIEQMIWALYSANPNAFDDGDIRKLKVGAILDVPARERILALSARDAHRELETRNQSRASPDKATADLEIQLEAAKQEREEAAKESELLKARLQEIEKSIEAMLRQNAERDAKLREYAGRAK